MIPRYTRPEMAAIWSPETRFRIWFEIEAYAADAMAELGMIPKAAAKKIWAKGKDAKFDVARIEEIEREIKHDVVAFLTHLAEIVGPEARFVHQGMTSSDVLDTCLNVQLVRAADLLIADVDKLNAALKEPRRANTNTRRPSAAPTASMPSRPRSGSSSPSPTPSSRARKESPGQRRARKLRPAPSRARSAPSRRSTRGSKRMSPKRWGSRSSRSRRRSSRATAMRCISPRSASSPPRSSGWPPKSAICSAPRCLEAEEFFSEGQKGSSSMPHKRNPVLSENLVGLARMVRAYVTPAMENVALWHERDISHSSVERMIGPDATVTLDFALGRLAGVIEKLVVYPDNMRKNLDRLGGLVHSQRVLLALTQKGVAREDAYRLVQRNAMKAWAGKGDFLTLLKADKEVRKHLSDKELTNNFDLDFHFAHVDTIFRRVFGRA